MDPAWRHRDRRRRRGTDRPLLEELVGDRARFDAAHPREEPNFYLSLLGTHPSHAGRGIGMALLAENLARIDREGMPAYLESSNRRTITATSDMTSGRSASSTHPVVTHR
jgi:GNAT superfamily N-acetyltransferase